MEAGVNADDIQKAKARGVLVTRIEFLNKALGQVREQIQDLADIQFNRALAAFPNEYIDNLEETKRSLLKFSDQLLEQIEFLERLLADLNRS